MEPTTEEPLEAITQPDIEVEAPIPCHACPKPFKKYYTPYRCEICNVASHRGKDCSGVKRWKFPTTWNCGKHHPLLEEDPEELAAVPPVITAYKGSCSVPSCKSTIKSNHPHIKCLEEGCDNRVHLKCSELDKVQTKEYLRGERKWSCTQCLTKRLTSDHLTTHNNDLADSESPDPKDEHEKLRILQWNADGLRNKIIELRKRAIDQDLDVLLIQESHLEPNQPSPSIPGFAALRVDRKNKKGGGLISYVKKSIIFEKNSEQCKDATEIQTFSLNMSKKKRIEISNLYCPLLLPKHSQDKISD